MTDICRALLENLYYQGYRYLAQDADGATYAYTNRPLREDNDEEDVHVWIPQGGAYLSILSRSPLSKIESLSFFMNEEPLDIYYELEGVRV